MKQISIIILVSLCFMQISFAQSTTKNIEQPATTISRFPIPDINDLPEDLKAKFVAAQDRLGFVPNVFFALAHRPDEFRAFFAYNQALMKNKSGLTASEKEMIIIATSNDNGCLYCVMSHGAKLRIFSKRTTISEQIAVNYREAEITKREKAMLDFAMKVSTNSKSINEDDFKILRTHEFSDEDIWDIAGITAFFGLSNRMMNVLKVKADEEFYMMGRK